MSNPKRILVADPDAAVGNVLRAELREAEFAMECFGSAREALRSLWERPAEVLVAELHLPDMDGMDLLRRVKDVSPRTLVILLTAECTQYDLIAALRQRAFSFFHKPFSKLSLAEMVREASSCSPCEEDIELMSAVPHWISLSMSCKIQTADRVVQFFRELEMDLPADDRDQVATALRELVINAVEHGAHSDPSQRVIVRRVRTDFSLSFYIKDPGPGFSFKDLKHAAISNSPESAVEHLDVRERYGMRPGGFGISMARQLLDGLYYNEQGNEVLLIKNLKNHR